MEGIAGVRQLGPCVSVQLPPWADEEPPSSMERRGRRMRAAWGRLLFIAVEPHSLGRGGGRGGYQDGSARHWLGSLWIGSLRLGLLWLVKIPS
jgi:hypothetical protein